MIVVGLTGSIGMGKSTTARLFAEAGASVFDADAEVAALYAHQGAAAQPIAEVFPDAVKDGVVDRAALSGHLRRNPEDFGRLEAIVHPLVAAERKRFVDQQRKAGADLVVLDVPLLFETGLDDHVDVIVVVTAPEAVQKQRVLSRPGMNEERFRAILSRQTPDSKKRAGADYVIDTSGGLEDARAQVATVVEALRRQAEQARGGRNAPGAT